MRFDQIDGNDRRTLYGVASPEDADFNTLIANNIRRVASNGWNATLRVIHPLTDSRLNGFFRVTLAIGEPRGEPVSPECFIQLMRMKWQHEEANIACAHST